MQSWTSPIMDSQETSSEHTAHSDKTSVLSYYRNYISSSTDQNAFQNLDKPSVLHESIRAVSSSFTRNFVLDFSDAHAWVGFDLSTTTVGELLQAEDRPEELNTRWINIWYPYYQKPLLGLLGNHFDFSPRLLALVNSDPHRTKIERPPVVGNHSDLPQSQQDSSSSDLEKGTGLPELSSIASNNPARTGNIYDIADEIWHYTSFDQGRNCEYPVCIFEQDTQAAFPRSISGYRSVLVVEHPRSGAMAACGPARSPGDVTRKRRLAPHSRHQHMLTYSQTSASGIILSTTQAARRRWKVCTTAPASHLYLIASECGHGSCCALTEQSSQSMRIHSHPVMAGSIGGRTTSCSILVAISPTCFDHCLMSKSPQQSVL